MRRVKAAKHRMPEPEDLCIAPTGMVRLKPDAGLVADAAAGTAALLGPCGGRSANGRRGRRRSTRSAPRPRRPSCGVQPQEGHLRVIREVLPRDGFLVEEGSQVGFAARMRLPVYAPRQYVTCGYQDNLGFGLNTALGVKVGNPDKAVVAVSDDGGFMFGAQELATARQFGLAVVAVVFNNDAFGNVRRDQQTAYGNRLLGTDPENPDFVALAQSFWVKAMRAGHPAELRAALSEALAANEPVVIEVPVPRGSDGSPLALHPSRAAHLSGASRLVS